MNSIRTHELTEENHEVAFHPSYPAHNTQAARLLAYALVGRKVDPLTGWRSLGIYRLSDTNHRLNKLGWPMESGRRDVSNKFGEPCHVALYGLPDWAIANAGKQGREFAQVEQEIMSSKLRGCDV